MLTWTKADVPRSGLDSRWSGCRLKRKSDVLETDILYNLKLRSSIVRNRPERQHRSRPKYVTRSAHVIIIHVYSGFLMKKPIGVQEDMADRMPTVLVPNRIAMLWWPT